MVTGGGLMSYGIVDQFRQAAGYVDRILRGEKAGDVGPYCSANPFRARRRGDRIVAAMSASGTKLPIRDIRCYGMDSEVVEKLSLTVWRLEEIVHASSFADQRDRVGSLA
jgi:hypothetical protein